MSRLTFDDLTPDDMPAPYVDDSGDRADALRDSLLDCGKQTTEEPGVKNPLLCSGSYHWPTETPLGLQCGDCGQPFSIGRLEGRDQHMPAHEPMRASDHDAAETATGVS